MPSFSEILGSFAGNLVSSFYKARGLSNAPFMEPGYSPNDVIDAFGETYAHAKGASDQAAQKRADQNAWFLSATLLIMGEAASANLHIVEQKQTGDVPKAFPNHPFEQIYYRPNPHMTGDWMVRYSTLWAKSDGNAYWFLIADENDILQEIWPLPSDAVYPVAGQPGSGRFVDYYEYRAQGKIFHLDPRYVCHFQNIPNKWNPFDGLSELVAGQLPIEADTAMLRWNAKFFDRDNVMPNAIINLRSGTPAKRPSPADLAALKSDLANDYSAVSRKTLVTGAPGGIDVNLLGWSARDMDFVAGRASTKSEIYHLMGVPEGVFDPSATEASAKQAAKILKDTVWTRTLVPFAATITAKIIWPFYGTEFRAIYDDIRPVDRELVLKENDDKRRVATFDEGRAHQGFEAYSGPFKDLIGALPYHLAINPQFVTEAIKIQQGFYKPPQASQPPQTPQTPQKEKPEEIAKAMLLREDHRAHGMLAINFPYAFARTMYLPLKSYPDNARVVPLYERHLTLKFFPDLNLDLATLKAELAMFCASQEAFQLHIGGEERFFSDSEQKEVVYHVVESAPLYVFRQNLVDHLARVGFEIPETYPNYFPHVTAAYLTSSEPLLEPLPEPGFFTVEKVTLHWGGEKTNFSLLSTGAKDDLRKWRDKVLRAEKAVSFTSEVIPPALHKTLEAQIKTKLTETFEAQTIKTLFQPYV